LFGVRSFFGTSTMCDVVFIHKFAAQTVACTMRWNVWMYLYKMWTFIRWDAINKF